MATTVAPAKTQITKKHGDNEEYFQRIYENKKTPKVITVLLK